MDKLKYIKLENENGSYSDSIPLAVDSDHVDVGGNTLTNELANKANTEFVNSNINNLNNKIKSLASGSPLVASSISEMTDISKTYVNTTDGNWYYYDGNNWEIGGIYQATEDSNTVQKLQISVSKTEESLIPSKNLYDKNTVEVHTYGGNRQTFKIINPIIGHYYAVFKKNGNYAYLEPQTLLIQYNTSDDVIHQYNNSEYNTYAIESNCIYIIFASVNTTDVPLDDLMVVDITGLSPSDFEYYDNGYSTLNKNTNIEEVKPESIKNVLKYNLYNPDEVLTLVSDSYNYQKQIIPCTAGNKFRFLTSTLERLTNTNYNDKNVIAFIYNIDNTTSRALQNPTEDITIINNEKRLELFVQNTTITPYNDIMIIRTDYITDNDIAQYGYLPYSYILKKPYYAESSIESNSSINKPYKGKKILSIGDSYTFQNNYGKKLEEITGCQQTPRGYNGARIFNFVSDSYTPTGGDGQIVEQVFDAELLAPYDIITIMGGTNNYGYSTQPLGDINDPATSSGSVYSEIKYVIEKILTLKPSIKMIWCTEPYRLSAPGHSAPGGYEANSQGFTMENVADAIIEVCNHYAIPVFDFYRNSGWNSYTVKKVDDVLVENKYTYDGLHPKEGKGNGAELLGEQLGMFINTH